MIESFRSRDLEEFFYTGQITPGLPHTIGADRRLAEMLLIRLDALTAARGIDRFEQPGFDLQPAAQPDRFSMALGGRWRLAFTWRDSNAHDVELVEQGH